MILLAHKHKILGLVLLLIQQNISSVYFSPSQAVYPQIPLCFGSY